MDALLYILPIFATAVLAAGWIGVQLLARQMNTKNLLDHRPTPCGGCDDAGSCLHECEHQKRQDRYEAT